MEVLSKALTQEEYGKIMRDRIKHFRSRYDPLDTFRIDDSYSMEKMKNEAGRKQPGGSDRRLKKGVIRLNIF